MSGSSSKRKEKVIEPRRLELSLNPEDGSLLTAPLSRVLIAATDGLYTDLFNMAHSELDVTKGKAGDDDDPDQAATTTQVKMSNLSFAQRRHELSWRLAQHAKALMHVASLTAALHSTELAKATIVSTKALKHTRTAWVQADEAQDALYFFHAQLFPARQAPHDVYGALDLLQLGQWKDLPTDLKLIMDRYETSKEYHWSAQEVKERWHMAVRDKLICGEVAERKREGENSLWKVAISGGIVRLTHGEPKKAGSQSLYPLEANLTVLSTKMPAQWTLLSVEVRAQAKTGESNHQLDTANRQRFDLHRLCAKAMAEEENRAKDLGKVARPLDCLFQIAHSFSLSWRLEILNSQAQSLKRGVWSTKSNVVVTPVEFFTSGDILGVVSISFWRVDDRYGPPKMSSLDGNDKDEEGKPPTANQLTLSIRAIANIGIKVSISGGERMLERAVFQPHTRSTVGKLLDAASNPFALSASNVLLAASTLCAEQRCHSMLGALQPLTGERLLPPWMSLHVESGSIAVSAKVSYKCAGTKQDLVTTVLFRLACDARSGTFISTFCRSAKLLRLLAANEHAASETMALKAAKLTQNRRRSGAATNSTGRLVRDAFEGLTRSMNVLGTRAGVGGPWLDKEEMSASLRQRAIQLACKDAKNSLITCCGMAVVYGLGALAIGVGTGISAQSDICGGPIPPIDGVKFINTPPVGLVLDQCMAYKHFVAADGEKKKKAFLERDALALTCSADETAIEIYCFNVTATVDSPASLPDRTSVTMVALTPVNGAEVELDGEPPSKRRKMDDFGPSNNEVLTGLSLVDSIGGLAAIIAEAVDT